MSLRTEQHIRAMALDSAVRWAVSPHANKNISGFEVSLDETDILDLADTFVDYITRGRD